MDECCNLEQFAHGGALAADQSREGLIDVRGARRLGLERGRALLDAEPAQKQRLLDRTEGSRTHGLDRPQ